MLAMLLYTWSHHQNRFQKLFTIYFEFHGLSAKGFDTLHVQHDVLGLIMSHKWACNSVSRISQSAIKEAHLLKDQHPWLLSYDNVNIPFRVLWRQNYIIILLYKLGVTDYRCCRPKCTRRCGGNFAVGFQTPPDHRAVMTVTMDGYETNLYV